ncbi:M35 family metallo-endopeptidase [Kitasatospora sp. MAP5-34]|uniref:M35 family metallo-endopeptidase n=1 Tax=Kitasatospora sp. MAP5-34 TaxID=3035102 RepID=UPI0024736D87|nr:M35 family metallo-endopeptidase [Kitasatospora sp. MAP5-34]MDH6576001.1 hypothetical protein [Kitasatospora sp. MAP5-34]
MSPPAALALQRAVGNRAFTAALQREQGSSRPRQSPGAVVQRVRTDGRAELTPEQLQIVTQALRHAVAVAEAAVQTLALTDDETEDARLELYRYWFGSNLFMMKEVRRKFGQLVAELPGLATHLVPYDPTEAVDAKGTVADQEFVWAWTRQNEVIRLTTSFWGLTPERQGTTLLHELTHRLWDTTDESKFGEDRAHELACLSSPAACNCAYNFEYYAKSAHANPALQARPERNEVAPEPTGDQSSGSGLPFDFDLLDGMSFADEEG